MEETPPTSIYIVQKAVITPKCIADRTIILHTREAQTKPVHGVIS